MKWKQTICNLYEDNNKTIPYDIEKTNYLASTSTIEIVVFINFIMKTFVFINTTTALNLLANTTIASALIPTISQIPLIDAVTSPSKPFTNAPTCSPNTDARHASTTSSIYKLSIVPSNASQSDTLTHAHIISFTVPPVISITSACLLSFPVNISPTIARSIAPTNVQNLSATFLPNVSYMYNALHEADYDGIFWMENFGGFIGSSLS